MGKAFKINLQTKTVLALAISLSFIAPTQAADFTIESGPVVTTPQTLDNDNDVGVIESGGKLNTTNATAITASAISNSVTNKGTISTLNAAAFGIQSTGANAAISNQGSISTDGGESHGILSIGDNATINNESSISTLGVKSYGIYSVIGKNAIISNKGSISTKQDDAFGILSLGDNATINNSSSISTNGASAIGIASQGDNAMITNSGSITTGGELAPLAYGILSVGKNAIITNKGSISTVGDYADSIYSFGDNATISNESSISTVGDETYGILSLGDDATISNQGSISTLGVNSYGINSNGNNANIINSGSIKGWGGIEVTEGYGDSEDSEFTITNSGLIQASNVAIMGGAGKKITLNLLPGSQIMGRIDLGDTGDNDTANVYGGVSANLTFENTENINLFGTGVRSGNNVVTVDTTGESTRGVALASMTSSIHNVIGQRMAQITPLEPVQVVALTLSPGMYFEEHKPAAWAQVFGGTFDRDAEGSALAYDYDHVGMNFGYEWDVNQHRVGLMGGVVSTDTQTQTASFSSDANNYYVGAYGNRKMNGFNITGSLLAGYGDHENDRLVIDNLNGFEVAQSDFDSFFISPSLTIASAYTVDDRLELRPSASMSYSMAWLDGYSEQGTTNSNITVDDRKAKALTAKVQLAAAYALTTSSEFEFRVGMNGRHTNDEDTKVGIAGSQFKFSNAGDESVTGGFAGASIRVVDENNLILVADMEFGGNSDEDYATGSVSLEYVF
jgi:hypothetical protein